MGSSYSGLPPAAAAPTAAVAAVAASLLQALPRRDAEADAEIACATGAGSRRSSALHSRSSSLHGLPRSGSGVGGGQGLAPTVSGGLAGASLMEAAVSRVFAQRDG